MAADLVFKIKTTFKNPLLNVSLLWTLTFCFMLFLSVSCVMLSWFWFYDFVRFVSCKALCSCALKRCYINILLWTCCIVMNIWRDDRREPVEGSTKLRSWALLLSEDTNTVWCAKTWLDGFLLFCTKWLIWNIELVFSLSAALFHVPGRLWLTKWGKHLWQLVLDTPCSTLIHHVKFLHLP